MEHISLGTTREGHQHDEVHTWYVALSIPSTTVPTFLL